MDSKLVSAELRIQVRPILRSAGFTRFSDRSAWRYTDGRIDVVNFQSFNSYLAEGIGGTTYSFALNLGCAFTRLPRRTPFRMRNGLPRPAEYECDLRRGLRKSIEQPELPRTDVWYIDDRGVYLMPCVIDAKHVLVDEGLPWFERFSDRSELLRTLVEDPEEMDGTWGFGNNPSPVRSYLIGYTALHLGKAQLALDHLERLVKSGSTLVTDQVRSDLAALQAGAPAA